MELLDVLNIACSDLGNAFSKTSHKQHIYSFHLPYFIVQKIFYLIFLCTKGRPCIFLEGVFGNFLGGKDSIVFSGSLLRKYRKYGNLIRCTKLI
jgi:hypothetical protein